MKNPKLKTSLLLIFTLFFVLACGLPSAATEVAETEAPATDAPTESAPPSTEAAPEIQHTDIPVNLPENQSGQAGDFDSSKILENKTPVGGDRFTYGRFERPFNANTMDIYFSQLDIVSTKVFKDDLWVYASISLKNLGASSSQTAKYALELDVNLDGKGDWLIVASKPESTEWVVFGVYIFYDENDDVGGEFPSLTDNVSIPGDGFEKTIFDQGLGNDPDSAWVRISPNDPNIIEFAVKQSAIETPEKFLINTWAGNSLIDPSLFDFNDFYTHEQAGAADSGLPIFYPIKEISEIDNSCRIAIGFQPTGNEPGLCDTLIPVKITDPLAPTPATCARPSSCNGCGAIWDQSTCTCTFVPC